MSSKSFDLSVLADFVNEILSSTESVKKILETECNEARSVLRACTIETTVTKKVDEDCCTCDSKVSLENHAEEIVDGIGRALAQAQELREKIANNISKQKRKEREPDVETIYMGKKVIPKTTKNPLGRNKLGNSSVSQSSCEPSNDVAGKNTDFKRNKAVAEKKPLRSSTDNAMVSKTTAQVVTKRDFVAANKSNIKNIKRNPTSVKNVPASFKKRSSDLSPLSGTSEASSNCAASIAELSDLMTKVTVEAMKKTNSELTFVDDECPYHGSDAPKTVDLRVRSTIDLMEGLDRFGIPHYLVRPLKTYHSYMRKELTRDEVIAKKRQRAADKFLDELCSMNAKRLTDRKATCPELVNLTVNFARLFRTLSDRASDRTDRSATQTTRRYSELDHRGKLCELRKFDPGKFRKSKTSAISKRDGTGCGWSSNGVWNRVSSKSFPTMTGIPCIRYASKGQLLLFFELNQRLQLLIYHEKLIDLITDEILPNIRENSDNFGTDFCEAYKMIFTIAQVLNPRIPTLVRTDV